MSASLPETGEELNRAPGKPPAFVRWHRRILTICLIIFAFELGVFLLIFPWKQSWGMSWIPIHSPRLAPVWMSSYFRGALSGLGLLDVFVALSETRRFLRSVFSSGSS